MERYITQEQSYLAKIGFLKFKDINIDSDIVKETGQNMYNVKFVFDDDYVEYGVISEDRLKVSCGGGPFGITYTLEWVDEKTAENIRKLKIVFEDLSQEII